MEFTNLEELLKKIGVKGVVVKAGEYKDVGSPFREMAPEEKKTMQDVIDNVHQQFIRAVVEGRKLERSNVIKVADGRIFTGEQALELKLVDRMGNLQDAIDMAAEMVGIEGKPQVVYPKRKFSVWDLLLGELTSAVLKNLKEGGFGLNYLLSPSS
jgi:protease-4